MIKFVCGACGKHLRARDEMATKRVFCPKCRALVGVPSLHPAHAGGAGPISPLERLQHTRDRKLDPTNPADLAALAADELLTADAPIRPKRTVRLVAGKPRRSHKNDVHLEQHWYECLLYPLRAFQLCLALSVMLTILSGGLLVFLPRLMADAPEGVGQVAFHWTWIVTVAFLFGFPCTFFDAVLTSACAGATDAIHWSGNVAATLFLGAIRWALCFLAGPVLFFAAGLMYWLSCGEPTWLDVLILAELGVVGIGFQLYVLLSMSDHGRLRDINPLAVADLAHRMGWSGLAMVLLAAAVLLLHGTVGMYTMPQIHQGTFVGWLLLAAVWTGVVFFGTFFARLLGLMCYRSRRRSSVAVPASDADAD